MNLLRSISAGSRNLPDIKMAATWTVVKFIADESVAAVPSCWINNDSCLWPPFSTEKVTSAIKAQKFDTCWPSHKIEVFRNATYESYEIARQKARRAEFTSDLNTTDNDEVSGAVRRKIHRKKYSSSSDSEVEQPEKRVKPRMPSPIRRKQDILSIATIEPTNQSAPPTLQTSQNNESFTSSIPTNNIPKEVSREESRKVTASNSMENEVVRTTSTPTLKKDNVSKCQCICPHHAEFSSEILRQLFFIRSLMTDMLKEVNNLQNKTRGETLVDATSVLTDFNVPFEEEAEYLHFEDFLKNPENYNKLECELRMWGGSSLTDFVKRCMGIVISNKLAATYSWLGRRDKKAFAGLCLARIVVDAALKSNKCADKKEVEQEISRWLRRAPERLKYFRKSRLNENV